MKLKKKTKSAYKYKDVTYSRINNLGNYENERIEVTLEVQADQTPEEVLKEAKKFVKEKLNDKHYDYCCCGYCE